MMKDRLQQTSKKLNGGKPEPTGKSITVCLKSQLYVLDGFWQWDLECESIYCSDVMSFPNDFEGAKGIIHPEDVNHLHSALALLQDKEDLRLEFRLITTYGEVKNISGYKITLHPPREEAVPEPGKALWEEVTLQVALRHKAEQLQLQKDLSDAVERLYGIGTWFINKSTGYAYYTNNSYRIHGLLAQSLNAHAHTFTAFIHPDDKDVVTDAIEKAYKEEVPLHLEYRIVKPDGDTRHVQLVTYWNYNINGQPVFNGILQDITEQNALNLQLTGLQYQLQQLHQAMQFLEHQTDTGYWFLDMVTRKVAFSTHCLRIYGLKQPVLPGYNAFMNLVHPEDRQRVEESMEQMYRKHSLQEMEFRIIRPDGKVKYIRQWAKLLISAEEEMMLLGIVQDITSKKGIEQKIQDLNQSLELQKVTYKVAEEAAAISSVLWHLPEGNMTWSDSFYTLLGYRIGAVEPSQRLLLKNVHPDDLRIVSDTMTLIMNDQNHNDIQFRLISKAGFRTIKMSFRRILIENKEAIVGLVQDITQQEAKARQLADQSQLIDLLQNAVHDMVIITNLDHTIIEWNTVAEKKTGISRRDAIHQNLFDVFPRLKEEEYFKQLQTALAGEKVSALQVQNVYIKAPHHYYLTPYKDEKGSVVRLMHLIHDISKELELQQRLGNRLNFIESLVEASVDRIVVLDTQMNYLYWNGKSEKYYGINRKQVIGKNILEIFPAFRNDPNYQEFRRVLRGEIVHIHATVQEESKEYFETYLIPIKNEKEQVIGILWVSHDLSIELQLQQERQKAEQEISARQELLKATIDSSMDMIQVFEAVRDESGEIVDFKWIVNNHTAEETYGDVIGKSLLTLNPGVVEEGIFHTFKKVVETGIPDQSERHYVHEQFNAWFYQSVVKLDDGVTTTTTDITERKKAEQELEETKDLLQTIFDTSPNSITAYKPVYKEAEIENFEIVFVNAFTVRTAGVNPTGMRLTQTFPTSKQNGFFDKLKYVMEQKEMQDFELWYEGEGMHHWFRMIAVPMEEMVLVTTEDITERKKAQEEILRFKDEAAQKATDNYYTLFNTIDEGFSIIELIYDNGGKLVDFRYKENNPAFIKEVGLDLMGKRRTEIFTEKLDYLLEKYEAVARTGEPLHFEHMMHSLGDQWFQVTVSRIGGEGSKLLGVIFRNITNHKLWEQQQEYLLKLSNALGPLIDPFEIQATACRLLCEYLDAQRVNYADIEGDEFIIRCSYVRGVQPITGRGPIATYSHALLEEYRQAGAIAINDVATDPRFGEKERANYAKASIAATASVMLMKGGLWVASFAAHSATPRKWTAMELSLVNETAEHTWASVERAKAEEALRRSEAMLEQQVADRTHALRQSTEELQKNVALLQHSEELAQIGSWEYDTTTYGFSWSEGMYSLFGLPQGSPIHPETYLNFAIKEDRPIAKRIVKNLTKKYQPFEETIRIQKGSTVRLLKVKGSVLHNEKGEVQKIVGVDLDITDITEAEEKFQKSQRWLQQTAVASPDAIVIYDLIKKQPIYLNNCLSEWLGLSQEYLVTMGVTGRLTFIQEDDRLRVLHFNEAVAEAPDGKVFTIEYRILTASGETRWVRNRSKVFERDEKGRATYLLSVLQDITEEKKSEEELKTLNTVLEKKNKELESKNEEITSFAFVASHDLREPLRKINTFSNWIIEKEKESLSQQGKDYLQRLQGAVTRMGNLIDDILILSRVNTQHKDFRAINLNDVLNKALSELQADLEAKQAVIESDDLPVVEGNFSQLLYLFKNLISNALKFQPKEAVPRLIIKSKEVKGDVIEGITDRNEDTFLQISFTDNGIGFDPKYSHKLFQVFQRLHSTSEYPGTGMGLTICKNVMENHRGYITAESEEGKGATFNCYFSVML